MRFKVHGNKADRLAIAIKNSDTVTIKQGSPIYVDPTQTGFEALSIEAMPDAYKSFFFGLACTDIAVNAVGEALVAGFYTTARVLLRTRTATTDNWASVDADSIGEQLDFVTGASIQAASRIGTIIDPIAPPLYLAGTTGSLSSVASATSDVRLFSTTTQKVFVRCM